MVDKKMQWNPALKEEYELYFSPEYIWQAAVTKYSPGKEFELTVHDSHEDWDGTKVGFTILEQQAGTTLQFYHKGWKNTNNHFRVSSYCWATYLRVLKRFLEKGIKVPYEERDNN